MKDNWAIDTSVFDQQIIGKRNLAFMIQTSDGIIGSFINIPIDKHVQFNAKGEEQFGIVDPQSFIFTIKNKQAKK